MTDRYRRVRTDGQGKAWCLGPLSLSRGTYVTADGNRSTVWAVILLVGWHAWMYGADRARRSLQFQYIVFDQD